jgi:hypothetical protein
MRVIIAGSRTVRDPLLVARAMLAALGAGIEPSVVLSGAQKAWDSSRCCYFGADYFGTLWAAERGIPVEKYPAHWKIFGKAAGPRRNQTMVDRADALVAVWDGSSRGTADVIRRARVAGLRVHVERVDVFSQ